MLTFKEGKWNAYLYNFRLDASCFYIIVNSWKSSACTAIFSRKRHEQTKIVSRTFSVSRSYSITEFENSVYAYSMTTRTRNFSLRYCSRIQRLCWHLVCVVNVNDYADTVSALSTTTPTLCTRSQRLFRHRSVLSTTTRKQRSQRLRQHRINNFFGTCLLCNDYAGLKSA